MITGIGKPRNAPEPRQIKGLSEKVTIDPLAISCATPRPATMHDDKGGDDRLNLQHGHQNAVPKPADQARSQSGRHRDPDRIAKGDASGSHCTGNCHHGTDRKINPFGGDDGGDPDGKDRHRRAPVQDVNQAAEKAATLPNHMEETGEQQPVERQHGNQRRGLRGQQA